MRPTSDPDHHAHEPDTRPPHDVITTDRDDPDAVRHYPESEDPNPGPWAEAPAHLRDDETDNPVPAQREPDHDGQLYVGAAHPDAPLTDDEAEHHEPVAVDDSGDPVDRTTGDTTDATAQHDNLSDLNERFAHDPEPGEPSPVVAAHGVAEPVDTDDRAEPAADLDHDGVADHPAGEPPAEGEPPAATAADEPVAGEPVATELKPGDLPVAAAVGFLSDDAVQDLRQRWREAQLGFVDDPRQAAEDVRQLVNEAIEAVTTALRGQGDELGEAGGSDTEQYRVTVQRCRALFDRLLTL
jgi:hypothetical protein